MSDLVVRAGLDASDYHRGLRGMRDGARMATGEIGRGLDGVGARLDGLSAPFRRAASGIANLVAPFSAVAAIGGTVVGVFAALTAEMVNNQRVAEQQAKTYADMRQSLVQTSQDGKIAFQYMNDPTALALASERRRLEREVGEISRLGVVSLTGMGPMEHAVDPEQAKELTRIAKENSALTVKRILEQQRASQMAGITEEKNLRVAQMLGAVDQSRVGLLDDREKAEAKLLAARTAAHAAEADANPEEVDQMREALTLAEALYAREIAMIEEREAKEREADAGRRAAEASRAAADARSLQHASDALNVELLRARGREKEADLLKNNLDIAERIAAVERESGLSAAEKSDMISRLQALGILRGGTIGQQGTALTTRSAAAGTSSSLVERVLGPQQSSAARAAAAQQQTARIVDGIRSELTRFLPMLASINSNLANGVPAVAG